MTNDTLNIETSGSPDIALQPDGVVELFGARPCENFFWLASAVIANKKRIFMQGGTYSSKTYSTLQFLILYANRHGGKIITVIGQDMPNLRKGALRDLQKILLTIPERYRPNENKTTATFTFPNGSIIEFTSYKDSQDARSGKRDVAFFNEANGITHDVFIEAASRAADFVVCDFNADRPFWAHQLYPSVKDHPTRIWIYSNYTDNPYLPASKVAEIEEWRDTLPRRWHVMGLGKTGKADGLVFDNVSTGAWLPTIDRIAYGFDFGFTTDPSTLIKVGMTRDAYYIEEIGYDWGIRPETRKEWLTQCSRNTTVVCDSADPLSIDVLKTSEQARRSGLSIVAARKGDGSVKAGIDRLSEKKIIVCGHSPNVLKELYNYEWRRDRNGLTTGNPVGDDHAIDAMRYALEALAQYVPPTIATASRPNAPMRR